MRPIGDKILFGLEGAVRIERHAARQRDLVQHQRIAVRLGGRRLAAPIEPPAPPRSSITIGWPSAPGKVLEDARDGVVGAAGRKRHQR